jgi:NADPH:quinone reductase
MLAAWCTRYGSPDVVTVEDVPAPEAGPGEVVVDIAAASVNFPDVLVVADQYQVHVDLPFIPGSEFAGTIAAVGTGVDQPNVGDRVMGSAIVGCFAEQIAMPARRLQPVPDGISLETAAAAGVTYRTAYHGLRSVARMERGDRVVVLGAAGGVGLAAVQVAKVLGGHVVAAASTEAKRAVCRSNGADVTVDSTAADLKERLREATDGGADVVIDPAGGDAAEAAIRAGRWGCRFISVGFASGDIPRIPLNLLLLKGVIVTGFTMSGLFANRPDDVARDGEELAALLAEGRLSPHVGGRFPLTEARAALAELAERRAIGKVLVIPGA